jgi:hypothetical protein
MFQLLQFYSRISVSFLISLCILSSIPKYLHIFFVRDLVFLCWSLVSSSSSSSSIYSRLLVNMWQSSDKSRSQQEIKAIYPSTLQIMCAVLISVTSCSSMADGWPGSNRTFWSNPFLIFPNAPVITGTIFVLAFPHPAVLNLQVFLLA